METGFIQHLLSILASSAISVGLLAFGFRSRREDGSRRLIFIVGGVIGCLMTIPVGFLSIGEIDREGSLLVLILCVIVLLASLILLRRGIRGRRVGDHPHCRRCGFDLFGRPETSHQCSECGANLDDSRAMVIGVRRRRASLIFGSLFLMLVSFGVGVPVWWDEYGKGIDWNKHKPDWWLVMQCDPSNSSLSSPAMNELLARLSSGRLSDSARHSMLKRVVATRASANEWTAALFISAEKRAADESLHRALVRLNCIAVVTVESEIPIGRAIPCTTVARVLYQSASTQVSMRVIRDEINGIELPPSSRQVRSPLNTLPQSFQQDQELLDLGPMWQHLVPESNDDSVKLKWKREVEINVRFRNGDQTLVDSSTYTVTRRLIAMDSSLFASEATDGPWHVTLRRAGHYAWIDIDPDDAFLEGQTIAPSLILRNAGSFNQWIGTLQTDGRLASSVAFSSRRLPNEDGLRASLRFQPSFAKTEKEGLSQVSLTTAPVADPGRKLPKK
ncbi:MAG TPA: hypothetical protein PK402_02645 [Tepidisphaeraceae bacterium]|nr:hypothetical protein [Tepidisphaeraceae bacterium]